ncbi:hypothetical protein MHH60_09680 [Paenibacillus sp. FSL H7-0716]|uniref:hypothetical protein n=1 Tax=Paenibacillus TaxID=44249 RepID=UPI0015C37105|nr:hypothetical protein [Paenibacillus odorifer]
MSGNRMVINEDLGLYDLAKYTLNVYNHQEFSPIYHCGFTIYYSITLKWSDDKWRQ